MCTDLHSDDTISKVAIENQDVRILALVCRELVAALAHYHRSGVRSYTKCKDGDSYPDSATKTDFYQCAEQEALDHLFRFIRADLFGNPRPVYMTEICQKVTDYVIQNGFPNALQKASAEKVGSRIWREY